MITFSKLVLQVGYSHPVEFEPEDGMEIEVPAPTQIVVKGPTPTSSSALE